eukprot:9591779-Karenia_brevis.AAC.1
MNYERKSQEHKFPKTARGENEARTNDRKSENVQQIMKLDDLAEDYDQDEVFRATIEAFSSK